MHKTISLLALLGTAGGLQAAELDRLQNLNQSEFRLISEDLGSAVSSKSYAAAAPLGVTGFDLGLNVSGSSLKHSELIDRASSSSVPSSFPMVQLRALKGLPWDIDIGANYTYIPGSDLKIWGAEVRYAILPGSVVLPSVSVRGSYTRLSGSHQLDLDTKGLDVSVSKTILLVTPYAGAGYVYVTSTPKNVAVLEKETFGYPKLFAGLRANLGVVGFTVEIDKTGDVVSYGLRMGIGF